MNIDQIESIIKDYRSKSDRELLAVIADLLLKLLRATKAHGKVKD